MKHLNQECFSPQNLSRSFHRLTSMQVCLVVICSSPLTHNFDLEGSIPTSQAFCIACNEVHHMEHLNQECFSPQNLSRSFHRLTSMQMCLVVICSSPNSHNFGLESPIPTIQAFLYSL